MMEVVFWASLFVLVYTYAGFFVLVRVLAAIAAHPANSRALEPTVALIIPAYNEEHVIRAKIENALDLDYPPEKTEIVVVTDGSNDATPSIAGEFSGRGVRAMHTGERKGKSAAMNRAVPSTRAEILVFNDANTVLGPDALRVLVQSFADRTVGAVSGRKIVLDSRERAATRGERGYWSYEAALKNSESRLGSISTADGEFFALRRALFTPIPPEIVHDDMYLTLAVVQNGYRVVFERRAVSQEYASVSLRDEFHLKRRYVAGGLQMLWKFRRMLLPPRSLFALQFLSHKVLRWLAPIFLLLLFACSILGSSPVQRAFGYGQLLFYGAALVGGVLTLAGKQAGPLYLPLYFTVANVAALSGILAALRGRQSPLWRKARR